MKSKFRFLIYLISITLLSIPVLPVFSQVSGTTEEKEGSAYAKDEWDEGEIWTVDKIKTAIRKGKPVYILQRLKKIDDFQKFKDNFHDELKSKTSYKAALITDENFLGSKSYAVFILGMQNTTPSIRTFCATELAKIYFYMWKNKKFKPAGVNVNHGALAGVANNVAGLINHKDTYEESREALKRVYKLLTRIIKMPIIEKNVRYLRTIDKLPFMAFATHIDLFPNVTKVRIAKDKYIRDKLIHYFRDPSRASSGSYYERLLPLKSTPLRAVYPTLVGEDTVTSTTIIGGVSYEKKGESFVPVDRVTTTTTYMKGDDGQTYGPYVRKGNDYVLKKKGTEDGTFQFTVDSYDVLTQRETEGGRRYLSALDTNFGEKYIKHLAAGLGNKHITVKYYCGKRMLDMVADNEVSESQKKEIIDYLTEAYKIERHVGMDYGALYWIVLRKSTRLGDEDESEDLSDLMIKEEFWQDRDGKKKVKSSDGSDRDDRRTGEGATSSVTRTR